MYSIFFQSKTFAVTQSGKSSGLTLDWQGGFSLYNTETRESHWKYKFSQLKGSSDDGKTKLKLHFQNENKHIETKVIFCQKSSPFLFVILFQMFQGLHSKVVKLECIILFCIADQHIRL